MRQRCGLSRQRYKSPCSGLGVIAGLIELFPEESRPLALSVSGIAVPILLIVDLLSGWARKAVVLGVISKDMSEVENKYRSLWEKYHLGQIDAADALSESDKLITQAYAISNRETFGVNDSINKDAVEEAYTAEKQRYATF